MQSTGFRLEQPGRSNGGSTMIHRQGEGEHLRCPCSKTRWLQLPLGLLIGTTVLLHCDLVYAASTAKFSMPFVKLGLCPEAASSLLLPISSGYQKAAELLLLGDIFTALKAYDTGIVSDVLEPEALDAHVQAQVKKLLDLPLSSLLTTKRLMKSVSKAAVSEKMAEEGHSEHREDVNPILHTQTRRR